MHARMPLCKHAVLCSKRDLWSNLGSIFLVTHKRLKWDLCCGRIWEAYFIWDFKKTCGYIWDPCLCKLLFHFKTFKTTLWTKRQKSVGTPWQHSTNQCSKRDLWSNVGSNMGCIFLGTHVALKWALWCGRIWDAYFYFIWDLNGSYGPIWNPCLHR